MDRAELLGLIEVGEEIQVTKYFMLAVMMVAVWDHIITLSDEVEYMWKKEKSWGSLLFVVSRYSILLYQTWHAITLFWPGYTQEVCDRTVKLEGYYFVFIITLGHIFLTMRVYAVTEASILVPIVFGTLVTSSLATGLWLVSVPSAKAVQMPKIPLDPFRACLFSAPDAAEWAYRLQVAFADLVTFGCISAFIFKLRTSYGRSRMSRLMRTIFQDGVLYFFVMAGFHIAMVFFTFFARPSIRSFPPVAIIVLIPVMISRLAISLRKAVSSSLVQAWDGDHFTTVEGGEHGMTDFANPSLSSMVFSPLPFKSPISDRPPRPDFSSPHSEA